MIEYQLDVLSNSAGELKDTRKKQKEGEMIQRAFLTILGIMVGLLALLFVVLVLLKGAIQKLFVRFGPKKTAVVATMAVVLLSGVTAMAGDTIVQIKDGNLVYYEKTKEIPGLIPKGITAEQARQLADGAVPSVKFSTEETGFYLGLPITKIKTDTTVFFNGRWIPEEVSEESLSVVYLSFLAVILVYCFYAAYFDDRSMVFALAVALLFVACIVFFEDRGKLPEIGALAVLSFLGGLLGRYLRIRRKKKQNAESHVLEVETVLEIET